MALPMEDVSSRSSGSGEAALAVGGALLVAWAVAHWRRYSGTPPGPRGLPLVGYLPFVGEHLHLDYERLRQRYGDVFSLVLGWRHIIVLNSYDVVKEAFVKDGDPYAGKPRDGIEAHFAERKSVFMTDGREWQEQRHFLLRALRDFGFGKAKLEDAARSEAQMICSDMLTWGDEPHNLRKAMVHAAGNIISSLIFDKRFDLDDTSLTDLLKLFEIDNDTFRQLNPIDLYPILEYLPKRWTGFNELDRIRNQFYNFIDKFIEEHERTFDENNMRDIVDVYLMKMKQLEKNPKLKDAPENCVYTRQYMRPSLLVLFSAGVETTATTTAWALKLLAAHPEVQARVQAEIDEVVGRERPPAMADRPRMPYTEVTLLEVQRVVSFVTFTFWHRIAGETTLRGYRIPKDALVTANLWHIHHDPDTWDDPMAFKPDRFLDSDGNINALREHVIPFSIGKRNCLGESLARMEMFIYLTSFLQKFHFRPPSDEKPFSLTPSTYLPVAQLKSYDLRVEPRF